MPGERTYGKRSRAAFDARLACLPLSSPDQPAITHSLKVKKTKIKPVAPRQIVQEETAEDALRTSPRRAALGEKHVNSVVLPLEALAEETRTNTKPRGQRRAMIEDDIPTKQRTAVSGKVASRGRQTFFDDEEPKSVPQEQIAQAENETTDATPAVSQPRRSPRKMKQKSKLVPLIPRHDSALDHVQTDLVAELERPQAKEAHEQESPYQRHAAEILQLSTHPLTCFATWSAEISEHFTVTKIAEASFGEVYRLSLLEDISDFCSTDESVFKVIPLTPAVDALPLDKRKRAAALRRGEGMTAPHDVATEVKLLQRMSSIPGFTNFRDIRVLQGRPPLAFIEAFKAWNSSQKAKKKELSHFPDSAKKSSYNEDQLWAVIEMQDAGSDLERFVESGTCTSVFPIWDILWHTVLSIAKGEEGAEFEHRDLHLGNICVRSQSSSFDAEPITNVSKLGFTSLETTIIDYTLSRCLMPDTSIAYTDLSTTSQAALFEGDSTEEYQYDIYRYMRGALYFDEPLAPVHEMTDEDIAGTRRTWEQFHPQTNLVWIHLVLYKLLEQIDWPSAKKAPPKNKKPEEFAMWKRENDLEHILLKVQDLLDPDAVCENGIRSATDLVAFAVGESWLDVEDVVGKDSIDESALISQLEGLEIQ